MRVNERGKAGEISAAKFLKKKKLKILERNFSCKIGEVDIIAFQSKKSGRKQLARLSKLLRKCVDEYERIDLSKQVAQKKFEIGDDYFVFVEVKSKTSDAFAKPETMVNARKKAKIVAVANQFALKNNLDDIQMRFDIVEVLGRKSINHIEGAF